MEITIVALFASMGLSFIGMAVAIFFDKSRLIDFFLSGVYGAWRGDPCAKFYKPVINIIRYGIIIFSSVYYGANRDYTYVSIHGAR